MRIKGPKSCDVFTFAPENCTKFPSKVLAECKSTQDEILKYLAEPLSKPSEYMRERALKRFKKLASFMEKLTNETKQELRLELPTEPEISVSVHGSMIGEISPHHEIYHNETSSKSPPSYNQLNYNEKLFRFFHSNPTTNSTDEAMNIDNSDNAFESNSVLSPIQHFSTGTGDSGGSANNSSSDCYSIYSNSSSNINPQPLTEILLDKHNDDMKKLLLKRHKNAKNINHMSEILKKEPDKIPDCYRIVQGHGTKRSGSYSWEEEAYKNSKHQHTCDMRNRFDTGDGGGMSKNVAVGDTASKESGEGEYDDQMFHQCETSHVSRAATMNQCSNGSNRFFPALCCIPFSQSNANDVNCFLHKDLYSQQPYMNTMMYPHMPLVSHQYILPHTSITCHPVSIPNLALTTGITCQIPNNNQNNKENILKYQQSTSRNTSAKVDQNLNLVCTFRSVYSFNQC